MDFRGISNNGSMYFDNLIHCCDRIPKNLLDHMRLDYGGLSSLMLICL